jgi:hypothetical protein
MARRPGRTVKLSISLDASELALLRKRAKRVSGGNVSAAIADLLQRAREAEGREELEAWFRGVHDEPAPAVLDAIRADWRAGRPAKKRGRAA